MKKQALAASVLVLLSGAASAADFTAEGHVIRVVPAYIDVDRQVQVCDPVEPQPAPPAAAANPGPAGAIIGGVVGGLLGHQVGHGSGNTAATIAGTIAGAAVGQHLAAGQAAQPAQYPYPACHMEVQRAREPQGYNVTYRFAGREFTETLPVQPGRTLRLQVHTMPAPVTAY